MGEGRRLWLVACSTASQEGHLQSARPFMQGVGTPKAPGRHEWGCVLAAYGVLADDGHQEKPENHLAVYL